MSKQAISLAEGAKPISEFALVAAGLLLTELTVGNLATYYLDNLILTFVSLFVFAGICTGSLIRIALTSRKVAHKTWAIVSGICCCVGYIGIYSLPNLGILWIILIFAGYGAYLSDCYARFSLKTLVVGFGIGGVGIYLALALGYGWVAPKMAIISIALVLGSTQSLAHLRNLLSVIMVLLVSVVALNYFESQASFIVDQSIAQVNGRKKIIEPIYSPLIRTDLYEISNGNRLLITNGRRYSYVYSPEKDLLPKHVINPAYGIPFLLKSPQKVLIIGPAGGDGIATALKHSVNSVTAVDVNPAVVQLMTTSLREFSGGIYSDQRVTAVTDEGRHFLETSRDQFDLITMQGVQTGTHAGMLNVSMLESYLLTQEALNVAWQRLTDDGCIWIDEYKWPTFGNKGKETLVQSVARQAKASLPLTDPDHQILLTQHQQSSRNPRLEKKWREDLYICKSAILISPTARKVLEFNKISFNDPFTADSGLDRGVTDQHPFIITNFGILRTLSAFFALSLMICALLLTLAWKNKGSSKRIYAPLFLTGFGFVLFVSAASGAMSLFVGDPQVSNLILFICLFLFGTLGGLLALKMNEGMAQVSLLGLFFCLGLLPGLLILIKHPILQWQNLGMREVLFVVILAPIGILVEVPYIFLLKKLNEDKKIWGYTLEKLGTLLGCPVAIFLQIHYGYFLTMIAAGTIYGLSLLTWRLLNQTPQRVRYPVDENHNDVRAENQNPGFLTRKGSSMSEVPPSCPEGGNGP